MPSRRFDWHERIKAIEGEFRAARVAVDRLKGDVVANPEILDQAQVGLPHLRGADDSLEGTYVVRLFAAFEAALRSYDRARHHDPSREQPASVLIDSTGGRRAQNIPRSVRDDAHAVRRVRNHWAHDNDESLDPMPIAQARARLQKFLSHLPEEWS